MFTCSRVKNDIIIQANFKKTLFLVVGSFLGLVVTMWLFWVLALHVEITRIKKEIYVAVSKSMGNVMVQNFDQTHANLLRLEACQAQLSHEMSINKDLSLLLSKNLGVEEKKGAKK